MAAGCAELGASGWMTYLLAFGAPMSALANIPMSSKLAAAFGAVVAVIFLSGAIIYSRLGVLEETRSASCEGAGLSRADLARFSGPRRRRRSTSTLVGHPRAHAARVDELAVVGVVAQ
jgi:hypothetical protein